MGFIRVFRISVCGENTTCLSTCNHTDQTADPVFPFLLLVLSDLTVLSAYKGPRDEGGQGPFSSVIVGKE